jgi:hypothetical protein
MSDDGKRLERARAFVESNVGKPYEYGNLKPFVCATAPMDPALAVALWIATGLPLPDLMPKDDDD